MGLFSKKKKTDGKDQDAQLADDIMSMSKKVKSVLATHIQESVAEIALDEVRQRTELITDDGERALVVVVDTEALGIISKGKVADPEAGGFFREIENSSILVMSSAELLAEDKFLMLPTADGIGDLEDYGFMRRATVESGGLRWAWLDLTAEELVVTELEATDLEGLRQGQAAGFPAYLKKAEVAPESDTSSETNQTLIDEKPIVASTETSAAPVEMDVSAGEPEEPFDDPSAYADPVNEWEQEGAERDDENDDDDEEEAFDPSAGLAPADDDADAFDPAAGVSEGDDSGFEHEPEGELVVADPEETSEDSTEAPVEPEVTDDRVILSDDLERVIERQVFNEELGLEIDVEAILRNLGVFQTPALLELPAGESWLDEQVALIAQNYNSALRAQRQEAEVALLEWLHGLMTRTSEDIHQLLDLRGDTTYGQAKAKLSADLEASMAVVPGLVREQGEAKDAEYEERKRQAGQQAFDRAVSTFDAEHRLQHESEKNRIGEELMGALKAEHDESLARLLKDRRADAQDRWRLANMRVQRIALESWRGSLASMDQLRQEGLEAISAYIDEHRTEEMRRIGVLAEEQARLDQVAVVKRQMDEAQERWEQTLSAKDAAMERLIQQHRADIASADQKQSQAILDNDARWGAEIEKLKNQHTASLTQEAERYAQLEQNLRLKDESYAALEKSLESKVAERTRAYEETIKSKDSLIAAKSDEAADAVLKAERAMLEADQRSKVNVALWVVAVVIACVIGFLVGQRDFSGSGTGSVDLELVEQALSIWLW